MIDFREPRLKVKRANQHITDLNREILAYSRKEPYRVIVDRDSEPGQQLLRVVQRFPMPAEWPLILGDAVHNLRSALDIMACDVMRYHGYGVSSVHFPFAERAEDLETEILRRTVHRARPEVVNLFYQLKPYKGGDRLLRAIHDLDVRDKHKLITPVVHMPGVTGVQVLRPDGSHLLHSAKGAKFLIDSEEKVLLRAPLGFKFQYDRKATIEIRFGEGPFSPHPIIPTLHQMSQLASQVILKFEERINHLGPPILLGYSP